MRIVAFALIVIALMIPALALTDYQKGVLDGLRYGWLMSQRYDGAKTGEVALYNQEVAKYNAWIEGIFGRNESLMLKNFTQVSPTTPYSARIYQSPVHAIDASWNQTTRSFYALQPQPDAQGLIGGVPAETYYSIGPALESF